MKSTADTFEVLRDIIVNKFDKDPHVITLDATLDTLDLDSLDVFDVIFTMEETFGVKVPNDELSVTTLQDLVILIDRLRNTPQNART